MAPDSPGEAGLIVCTLTRMGTTQSQLLQRADGDALRPGAHCLDLDCFIRELEILICSRLSYPCGDRLQQGALTVHQNLIPAQKFSNQTFDLVGLRADLQPWSNSLLPEGEAIPEQGNEFLFIGYPVASTKS